jgi:vacuolar-type H+-ATPase subunit H
MIERADESAVEAVDEAAELLRDILLRADRATLADVQSQLTELRQQMNDRTRAAAELAPALNRALARNARETQDQMVAALYPIFFPLLRRAIRGWFERVVDDFKSLFG